MSKIIRIPEAASIAIHSMVLIADAGGQINANQIAELTNASKNHISKILHQLVKYNYLESNRGPKGGFTIHPDAKNASLLEIYELIEGVLDSGSCGNVHNKCPFDSCVFGGLTEKFTNEFRIYLSEKTINDIIKKK